MSALCTIKARRHAVSGLCTRSLWHTAVRRFACLSVHVNCGDRPMSAERLRRTFEKVGKVWDVIPVEASTPDNILTQALVRFYEGDYESGASPGDPPLSLPPPTGKEVDMVTGYVRAAVERFNKSILNGVELYVCQSYDHTPTQLHKWYEDAWMADPERNHATVIRNSDIFPIDPFSKPIDQVDDYQKGFQEGFKLGMKDGSSDIR